MYYIVVRDGKMEKDGKNKSQHLGFLSHNTHGLATVIENLIGEKEKWTNKQNGKHLEADSRLHNATSHTQHLYQISKS